MRPRNIDSPEQLWQLFEGYKKEVKDNPRIKVEYVGKEGQRVNTPIERPLSIEGFKCYCFAHAGDINRYWYNVDKEFNEFVSIISRIREEIRSEQIDGGMVGAYNSNLTARLNGLADKKQHDVNIEQPLFGDEEEG